MTPAPEGFALLRELLNNTPNSKNWERIVAVFDRWLVEERDDLNVLLDYANQHLRDWPADLRRLPSSWLQSIQDGLGHPCSAMGGALILRDRALSLRDLEVILQLPDLHNIKLLDISSCRLGWRCIELLRHSSMLSQLEYLELNYNMIGHLGLGLLMLSPQLHQIRYLGLSNNFSGAGHFDELNLEYLARTPHLRQLESLYLDDNRFELDKIKVLASSEHAAGLVELSLNGNVLGDEFLEWLVATDPFPGLQVLKLERSYITNEGRRALKHASRWSQVLQFGDEPDFQFNAEPERLAEYYFNRALWMHKPDEDALERSIALNERVLELAPEHIIAMNNKGDSLRRLGRYDEALACFDECIERAGPSHANLANFLCNKARVLMKLERFDEAEVLFHQSFAIDPGYSVPPYDLACIRSMQGDVPGALSFLRVAVRLDPSKKGTAAKDDDLRALRTNPAFQLIIGD